jgi:DNA-binding IclR family transcriptional regulator
MVLNEAVVRAVDIINLVASSSRPLTLAEICKQTGIPKTSAFGIVNTLVHKDVLELADDQVKTFRLGLRILETTLSALSETDLSKAARPVLEELNSLIGETILFAVEDTGQMVFLDIFEGQAYLRATVKLGTRVDMHCSAIGKAVLAAMSEQELLTFLNIAPLVAKTPHTITSRAALMKDIEATRQRKYSLDAEENIEDVRCVGAPIYSRTRKVIAGVSITTHASRVDLDKLEYYGSLIHNAALKISRRMGFSERDLYRDDLAATA